MVFGWLLLYSQWGFAEQTGQDLKPQRDDTKIISWEIEESLQPTIDYLKKKQRKYRSQTHFLKHLFHYVHHKHLKRFGHQSSPDALAKSGTYDCVSGTALYALILEELNIPYEIWEMNYHVYLALKVNDSKVVFESTNPVEGFINQADRIAQHRSYYEEEAERYHQNQEIDVPTIHRAINFKQLCGLQFYNQALAYLQKEEKDKALRYVQQALDYYPSDRIALLAEWIGQ